MLTTIKVMLLFAIQRKLLIAWTTDLVFLCHASLTNTLNINFSESGQSCQSSSLTTSTPTPKSVKHQSQLNSSLVVASVFECICPICILNHIERSLKSSTTDSKFASHHALPWPRRIQPWDHRGTSASRGIVTELCAYCCGVLQRITTELSESPIITIVNHP